MRVLVRAAMALASMAMVMPQAQADAQAKPVVAVLYFDNNSIGRDARDYDGVGKGMAELMTNDLLSNGGVTVVERERVQALLVEQSLTKDKTIDPATAIRLGKIIGAQYMIYGAFMSDGRGQYVLTAKTVNVQTSQISNPTRITTRGDDVLGMIAQLNEKLIGEMKLPAISVGQGSAPSGAAPAGQPAAHAAAPAHAHVEARPAEAKSAVSESKPAQVAQAKRPSRKMDMKTAMLYSKALEEEDAGNRSRAIELYRQVNEKFPDYAPVQKKIAALSRA
ncbi:MAG: CsgG/HfaB family protein [Gemmatimonadaceae bacterium]